MVAAYLLRRSDSSSHASFSGDSVISAITYDDEEFNSNHSRRSIYKFDPKLRSLTEQKRVSDPQEEEVKQFLEELRVNRFSPCSSNNDKQLCAIPRRRQSMEYTPEAHNENLLNNNNKEAPEDEDIEDEEASIASMQNLEGSFNWYDYMEMASVDVDDDEMEYELPIKDCDDDNRPKHKGRPRRKYPKTRRRSNASSTTSSSISSEERSRGYSRSLSRRRRHAR